MEDETKKKLDEIMEMGTQIQAQASADRDLTNQLLGQIQMAGAINKLANVISLTKLAYIKEHKLYRALHGQKFTDSEGNEILGGGTWEGFCKVIGSSRQKIEEDLQNLRIFGEEALDAMKQMGIGYREMRQYRRLPEDQKTALTEAAAEAAQTGDKESFVELAEEIISKHVKEKEALEKTVEDLQSNLSAREQVLKDKSHKLDATLEELLRLKNIPPAEEVIERSKKEDAALRDLWEHGLLFIGFFNNYLSVATGILNNEDLSSHASETVLDLTSGLCHRFAEDLLDAGIDIDFRRITYPQNCPQRGDDLIPPISEN